MVGSYESTLFGDRAVEIIERHAAAYPDNSKPLFLYLAFHNEHDPHQAPRDAIDKFGLIRSDTYKVPQHRFGMTVGTARPW